jgi:hypothetical protein
MYIATGYFGTGNQIIATGGTETLWISGSIRYKSHEFKATTGTFQVLSGKTSVAEVLVVGAGGDIGANTGSIGNDDYYGGGGGAGGFIYSSSISLQAGNSYTISAGAGQSVVGGGTGKSGNPSQISGSNLYISASGGGGGANGRLTNGKDGGSGGGGGSSPGSGITGQGSQGGFRAGYYNGTGFEYWGGGGGGAAGNGSNAVAVFRGGGGYGGIGKISRILNGTTIWYSGGGGGWGVPDSPSIPNVYHGGSGSLLWPTYTLQGINNSSLNAGGGTYYLADSTTPGTIIIKYPYQAVNVNNCDCYQFSVTGSSPTAALISYVQGGTGNFVEAESLPQNTIVYKSVVSGSQSQIYNWDNGSGNVTSYSKVYDGFCTSSI